MRVAATLLLLLLLPAVVRGQEYVASAHETDFAIDAVGLPGSIEIARHWLWHGDKPMESGIWRTTFQLGQWIGGDMWVGEYKVLVRAMQQPRRLHSAYYYRMRVQVGSANCSGFILWADGSIIREPSAAELRRRQEAGECPGLVIRVWQVQIGEGR